MLFRVIFVLGLLAGSGDGLHSAMKRVARSRANNTKESTSHANGTTHIQNFVVSEKGASGMSQLFVAIFAKRSSPIETRNVMRSLWSGVDDGTGAICARFAMCQAQDEHQQSLMAESQKFGDFLFLPCTEGYLNGLLTKKVISIMKEFRQSSDPCLKRPLMMKVDDDTFVAGHRFRDILTSAATQFGTGFMYAGVPIPDIPRQVPIRDESSQWYESHSTWPQDFPPAMYGGPGYIMGRQLVEKILDEGVAERKILNNEDRAVGVWVYLTEKHGTAVHQVVISGSNGFSWDHPVSTGTWSAYPYVLHHHLTLASITCLAGMDRSSDPNANIDHCFR